MDKQQFKTAIKQHFKIKESDHEEINHKTTIHVHTEPCLSDLPTEEVLGSIHQDKAGLAQLCYARLCFVLSEIYFFQKIVS